VLIVGLVLVYHASEKSCEPDWGLTLQHKLVKISGAPFFKHDTHGAFGFSYHTASASTFDVWRGVNVAATNSDSPHVHLLRVALLLDSFFLQLVEEFKKEFGSLFINDSKSGLSINKTLTSDNCAHSIKLMHAVHHVFFDTRPSRVVFRFVSSRIEADRFSDSTSLFNPFLK